ANDNHYLLLTHHHLLLDGWSLNIIIQEVLHAYLSLRSGQQPQFKHRRTFSDYISWLRRQNIAEAEAFWRNYLQGFADPTPLLLDRLGAPDVAEQERKKHDSPSRRDAREQDAGEGREPRLRGGRQVELQGSPLSQETTSALSPSARQHQLTLNTVIQGAW